MMRVTNSWRKSYAASGTSCTLMYTCLHVARVSCIPVFGLRSLKPVTKAQHASAKPKTKAANPKQKQKPKSKPKAAPSKPRDDDKATETEPSASKSQNPAPAPGKPPAKPPAKEQFARRYRPATPPGCHKFDGIRNAWNTLLGLTHTQPFGLLQLAEYYSVARIIKPTLAGQFARSQDCCSLQNCIAIPLRIPPP